MDNSTKPRALPNLDLLRSVAVLLVVFDHIMGAIGHAHVGAWDTNWIGRFGVDLFFVHTSLVLMWSLERKPHSLDFYIRRVFRIYPLAWLAILTGYLTHAPLNPIPGIWFHQLPLTLAYLFKNLLLIQDLLYAPNAGVVLWSLPIEVQMYVLLPALFFYVRKERTFWSLLLIWMLIVAFCHGESNLPDRQNLVSSAPMFLAGVMAYLGFQRWTSKVSAWFLPLLIAALLAVFMTRPSISAGWWSTLVLGLSLPLFNQLRSRWVIAASHHVAKYSYGIYLGHPFALVLGIYLLRGHSLLVQIPTVLFATAVIAVAAFHCIENPLIRLGSRVAARLEIQHEKPIRHGLALASVREGAAALKTAFREAFGLKSRRRFSSGMTPRTTRADAGSLRE